MSSILKPDQSVMAGLATVGTVFGVYNLNVGSVSTAHASDSNHASLESSRKKAAWTSFILVSGLGLITKDGNLLTLGYASIIGSELLYRHAIMVEPQTGKVAAPNADDFKNASDNVTQVAFGTADDVSA